VLLLLLQSLNAEEQALLQGMGDEARRISSGGAHAGWGQHTAGSSSSSETQSVAQAAAAARQLPEYKQHGIAVRMP
jgi:hypothetical protein